MPGKIPFSWKVFFSTCFELDFAEKLHLIFFVFVITVAPSAPRSFSLVPSSIAASWNIPLPTNGVITSYTVVCNDTFMLVLQPSPSDLAIVETVLTGLQPFTVYECSVFANTSAGRGPESETRVAMTTEAGE